MSPLTWAACVCVFVWNNKTMQKLKIRTIACCIIKQSLLWFVTKAQLFWNTSLIQVRVRRRQSKSNVGELVCRQTICDRLRSAFDWKIAYVTNEILVILFNLTRWIWICIIGKVQVYLTKFEQPRVVRTPSFTNYDNLRRMKGDVCDVNLYHWMLPEAIILHQTMSNTPVSCQ